MERLRSKAYVRRFGRATELVAGSAIFAVAAVAACSSSSSSNSPGADAGRSDGGGAVSEGGGQLDSGGGNDGGGGGDGGPCQPRATVNPQDLLPYATVQQRVNACTGTQISGFLVACGTDPTSSNCVTFRNDAANATCMSCMLGINDAGTPTNTGGMLISASGVPFTTNTPGCIALLDQGTGSACAQVLEPLLQCDIAACGNTGCASTADFLKCTDVSHSGSGACAQAFASSAPCAADFQDGGVALTKCNGGPDLSSPQLDLNAICGTGVN